MPPRERIRQALLHHSIENARHAYRDNLVSICPIYHSAVRLGMDADALFREAASLSAREMAGLLMRWLGREPRDQSPAAFGYREIATAEGIRFG